MSLPLPADGVLEMRPQALRSATISFVGLLGLSRCESCLLGGDVLVEPQ